MGILMVRSLMEGASKILMASPPTTCWLTELSVFSYGVATVCYKKVSGLDP